jgi:hypothetical protein
MTDRKSDHQKQYWDAEHYKASAIEFRRTATAVGAKEGIDNCLGLKLFAAY